MKKDEFIKVTDETLTLLLEVADEYLEEITEQFEAVGNPEKLIGKPYETWTDQDRTLLSQVYGEEPNPLSRLIFNKEYEKVLTMEQEV